MSISINRYVDITSGVGGGGTVAQRELIGRLFNDNPLIPNDAIIEFTEADDVSLYFGSQSAEYARALLYFSFISKNITRPKKLSFARWSKLASEARIYGARVSTALAAFQAINAGAFTLSVGGQVAAVNNLDLSGAVSLAGVAALVQTAIRAQVGSQFANALVTYDAVAGTFNFVSSVQAAAPISINVTNLGTLLGWNAGAVLSPGAAVQTISQALAASVDGSNNFGSFAFIPALSNGEILEAAQWNAARNVEFMFCARVSAATAAAVSASCIGLAGTALTLATLADQYDELAPMIIMAATDYTRRNGVQNYMFQQLALGPKVLTNADADFYDALRVNYYGNTQTAGQQINFYQRGVLMGGNTAPVDMNTYANEEWFKDRAQSQLMSLMLLLPRLPANVSGRGAVLASLQECIDNALFNGVISIGKPLTQNQKLYITDQSGDELAWHQVQNAGFWVTATVVPTTNPQSGLPEYKIVYVLLYSKDDAVRKVEGTHILI